MDRRAFLGRAALVGAAVVWPQALWPRAGAVVVAGTGPYGPVQPADANGFQLPAGFTSRRLATSGQLVAGTSHVWHAAPDGGSCFLAADDGWVYVSNAEVSAARGGASALRFAPDGSIAGAYPILTGTSMNCAGGATPWGTWLSCEENGSSGKVYECNPQQPGQGTVRPFLGSFSHEAAAVDPATGFVYLTEDHASGRLYRFLSTVAGDLGAGTLQAASLSGTAVTWVTVTHTTPARGAGTTVFNGGEGAWIADGTLWFTTKGDGRVWELDLASQQLTVLYDAATTPGTTLNAVDNITRHEPSGDLFLVEDGPSMEVALVTTGDGVDTVALFAKVVGHGSSEVTGPAFSPDGTRLYLSSQRGADGVNGVTYEITGPFRTSQASPPVPEVLVAAGATWRYLDDGSNQGTAWRTAGFADAGWKQGAAPLGYGDPMATTIGYGPDATNRYVTTYFRRTFEVTHGFESMVLRLRRDDGAVVYVNGAEVARSNMPTGTITSSTLASTGVAPPNEVAYFSFPVSPALVAGTNVVAVELHQNTRTTSDASFALALEGTGDTGPIAPTPTPATLEITTDAYVADGSSSSTSFGTATILQIRRSASVGQNRIAYFGVDTTDVSGPIQSAKLRVACRHVVAATTVVDVLGVPASDWTESGVTWSNRPALGPVVGSFTVTSTAHAWKEVDVTAYVNAERAVGRPVVSFGLWPSANGQLVQVNSSDAMSLHPELRLNQ